MAREEPIDVVTVFSGAPEPPQRGWWDARTGFANSDESIAARRREDEAAFTGTPHRRTYLDLLELQHTPKRTAGDRERIGSAVTEWLTRHRAGAIAIPAGAGCSQARMARWLRRLRRQDCWAPHVDHLYVRNVVLDALRSSGGTPLLYEEVPYLFGGPADREADRAAAAGGWRAEPLSVEIDRNRKVTRVAAYASQIPHISPDEGRLDDPRILPSVERYWLLRRTSA